MLCLQGCEDFILGDPDWAPIFAPGGRLARRGEKIARVNYSNTLKTIADEGAEAFYSVRLLSLSVNDRCSKLARVL